MFYSLDNQDEDDASFPNESASFNDDPFGLTTKEVEINDELLNTFIIEQRLEKERQLVTKRPKLLQLDHVAATNQHFYCHTLDDE